MKTMAKKNFWMGILAMALVFGMTFAACGGGNDDSGNGPGGDPNGPDGPSGQPFTSVEEVKDYIISAEGGADADDPVLLPVKINLGPIEGTYYTGWFQLMDALKGGVDYKDGEFIPKVASTSALTCPPVH